MTAAPHAPPSDEAQLREEGARIEALLAEVSAMAGPQTWPRVEELIARMLALYGAGLGRVLHHARDAARQAAELDTRLADDELVSSLLLLHGLHPRSTEERARRALERVRPYLGSHGGGVELLGVEGSTARLRLSGSCDGCPSSRATVEHTLRHAIEEDAPEIVAIEVEADGGGLVQIGDKRQVARWDRVEGLDALIDEVTRGAVIEHAGVSVLVLRTASALVAYRNQCRACGAGLDPARLDGDVLSCACGQRFDAARGGRSLTADGPHLTPVPLLAMAGGHRIALPEGGT